MWHLSAVHCVVTRMMFRPFNPMQKKSALEVWPWGISLENESACWCDMWILWNARWMERSIIKMLTDGCGKKQHGLPAERHVLPPLTICVIHTVQSITNTPLIYNVLEPFFCASGRVTESKHNTRLKTHVCSFNSSKLPCSTSFGWAASVSWHSCCSRVPPI